MSSDFVNHSYDYRPNWTSLSPITIINNHNDMIMILIILLLVLVLVHVLVVTRELKQTTTATATATATATGTSPNKIFIEQNNSYALFTFPVAVLCQTTT